MQAVVYDGELRYEKNYPAPELTPGEAMIVPHIVGICNTDVEITRGYMGFQGVLGHEFVGDVSYCEDESWVGKRVVGEINASCGVCPTCRRGDTTHCPHRTTLGIFNRNGAMSESFLLPVSCLHVVPDGVSDDNAVFTEPLAAAIEIVQQTHVKPTDHVAVIGDGKLGMLVAMVLRLTGCNLTLIGHHPERWQMLASDSIVCVASTEITNDTALQHTYDIVVDCTGHASGLATARQLVRPRGTLIIKSTYHGTSSIDLSAIVVDEVNIVGSRCGPFAPALRLLERGLVQPIALISKRFALSDALDAFTAAQHNLKVVFMV